MENLNSTLDPISSGVGITEGVLDGIIVIGVDPPVSKNCGWSVIKIEKKTPILLEKFTQVLEAPEDDLNKTLEDVYQKLNSLFAKYPQGCHPAVVLCMERQMGGGLFFARAKLNEFVGVMKLCCWRHGIKVAEISPGHLKLIIAGHGSATKNYIMGNVVKTFGLSEPGPEHECDAASLALCYMIDKGWINYEIKVPYSKKIKNAEAKARADRKKKIAANKAKRLAAEQAKAAAAQQNLVQKV